MPEFTFSPRRVSRHSAKVATNIVPSAPRRASFRERARAIRTRWNAEWWSITFGGPIGNLLAALVAEVSWITPDRITLTSFLAKLAAAALVLRGDSDVAVVVLLQVHTVLDCMDGSLARYRRRPSAMGAYLDKATDMIGLVALLAALGWRAQRDTGDPAALLLALLVGSAVLLRSYLYWVVLHLEREAKLSLPGSGDTRVDCSGWSWRQRARKYVASMPRVVLVSEADLYFWFSLALLLSSLRETIYAVAAAQGFWLLVVLWHRTRTVRRIDRLVAARQAAAPVAFLDEAKVAAFWNGARKAASEEQHTGYLQDEWPSAVARNRLLGEQAQVARWLEELGAGHGACLDVGCGNGAWLARLAPRFGRAHGVDLSSVMVDSARRLLARHGQANVTLACQSVAALPEDERYDVIFVGGVLMYHNDGEVAGVVAKLARLLAPGGLLLLRESTCAARTWYRDTPLSPGLFAEPGAPRPPYFAIYRQPEAYLRWVADCGLTLVAHEANRHYQLADLTETLLRWSDRLLGGRLASDRAAAERVAQWLHRWRALTLLPAYYVVRTFAPGAWRLQNHWYVCRQRVAPVSQASQASQRIAA